MCKSDPKPEDVLPGDFLEEYTRDINALHLQVSGLSTNLFVLEHLVTFPFGLFAPDEMMFWNIVIKNMCFSVLLTAWAIGFDRDSRSLTIMRFSNGVFKR